MSEATDGAPDGIDPYWVEQGLPEACPECGEGVNLYAKTQPDDRSVDDPDGEIQIRSARVGCDTCGHEWGWEADDA